MPIQPEVCQFTSQPPSHKHIIPTDGQSLHSAKYNFDDCIVQQPLKKTHPSEKLMCVSACHVKIVFCGQLNNCVECF
jgi:hypothetical protein